MSTFVKEFIKEVESQYTGAVPLYFGTANAPPRPFIAVLIVPPADETPDRLCLEQGEGGAVTLQWSLAAESFPAAYNALEELKDIVQSIRGEIGTAPDTYRVESNRTEGVVNFDSALGTWSAVFESPLMWSAIVT
jgi:hypothetical protein